MMSSLISVTQVGSNTESLQCGSLCGCVCDRMADTGGPDRSVQMEALEFWVYETAFQQC